MAPTLRNPQWGTPDPPAMLASLGGALALLLGLAVLLLPLLTPELSRPRDALWGAVVLLLGLVLVTSADRLTGAPMLGVLCGGLLIGRLGLEVAQARWFRLLPEERQQLWSAKRWQGAWAQLSQASAKLLALGSQSLVGLGAWISERRQPRSSKRWVRPEQPGSETGPEPGAEPGAEPKQVAEPELMAEQAAKTSAEPEPEAEAETSADPVAEPVAETAAEPVAEPSAEPQAEPQPERAPDRDAALDAQLEDAPDAAPEAPPGTPPAEAPETALETAPAAAPIAPDTPETQAVNTEPAAPETTAPNTPPAAPGAEPIAAAEPVPTTWISSLEELDSLLDQAAPTPAIDSDPASANASASADADADAIEPERAEPAETARSASGGAADLAEQAPASAIAAANQPEPPAASDQAG